MSSVLSSRVLPAIVPCLCLHTGDLSHLFFSTLPLHPHRFPTPQRNTHLNLAFGAQDLSGKRLVDGGSQHERSPEKLGREKMTETSRKVFVGLLHLFVISVAPHQVR